MTLNEFIDKYASEAVKKQWGHLYKCKFDEKDGFFIPSGFCLINRISKIPHLIILVNSYKRAMIKYDGQLSISIFNSESELNNALLYHNQYFEERYGQYHAFKSFCDSAVGCDPFALPDRIIMEIHAASSLDDQYTRNLRMLLELFRDPSFDKWLISYYFIRESYNLLLYLEQFLISLQNMKLVKIADVYYSETNKTYHVLSESCEYARYVSFEIEVTINLLTKDGWKYFGEVNRNDNVRVKTFSKDNKIIAVWDDIAKNTISCQ